ncbi:MAG: glutamate-5-semialdehyde dehydrogenase [Deltaproteobacteria bacterium]|nr:glutamate-5-semialdehyde dehydrogenase [Deltaproteobacteria bacterium]
MPTDTPAPAPALAEEVERLLAAGRAAALALYRSDADSRRQFVRETAALLGQRLDSLLDANLRDLHAAGELPSAMRDRLRLDAQRVAGMARDAAAIAELPEVVGAIVDRRQMPNGLVVERQRVPLGLIGIIYEARPNVTIDAAVLALRAGNAVVLRGGSEAAHTNAKLAEILRDALRLSSLPPDAVQTPRLRDRALVDALVGRAGGLDLAIPRGGTALIEAVSRAARVPVIQHYQGVCHLYVDGSADLAMAATVAVNAKAQRPGVCNAMEALLVDSAIAGRAVPVLVDALRTAGVEVRGCPRTLALVGDRAVAAADDDYGREFLELRCLCAVVDGVSGAVEHIGRYGSHHTEAIVAADLEVAETFVRSIDASCVAVNASTRFNDGGCLGLGAEIGISTTKLHAYGPMGLEALTAVRFVVRGQGQVRT